MESSEWTPDEWHLRADEAMAMAEKASDPSVKAVLFMIVQRYHDLAIKAEEKLRKPKT